MCKQKIRLDEVLKEKQKTSFWLSEQTSISKRSIDEYRSNRREPSFIKGMKICDALGIDAHTLLKKGE